MKNILFTTVRQGNCGDEFILQGVLRLIDTLQDAYNPIILNKNVEVCRRLALRTQKLTLEVNADRKLQLDLEPLYLRQWPSLHDNSFADYYSLDFIDAVVFAGTPEWMGFKLDHLYRKLSSFGGPIFFLGVGYHEGLGPPGAYSAFPEKEVHKLAKVFAVRDSILLEFVSPEIRAVHLPCPALLACPGHRVRSSVKRIGFSLQAKTGDGRTNPVPAETYEYSLKLLESAALHYEVEVVCHWIEDLIFLQRELGGRIPLRYSYDARDYHAIYDRYDLVVSTRVHGSGLAASLGIPSFTISHSARTDTVKGFLSRILTPADRVEDVLEEIRSLDPIRESTALIAHKEKTLEEYRQLLMPYFPL